MENLLAEMDRLISEIADVARDYQRMAQETQKELDMYSMPAPHTRPLARPAPSSE